MRTITILLALSATASTGSMAIGQQVCDQSNIAQPMTAFLVTLQPAWLVAKVTPTQPLMNVTAIDVQVFSNVVGLPVQMGIFDIDPTTGVPTNLIASGITAVNPEQRTYTVTLSAPVNLMGDYAIGAEIGVLPGGRCSMPYTTGGTATPLYAGSPGSMGLFRSGAIAFRVYCGTHSGTTMTYGQGKAGTGGLTPTLYQQGFSNIGNPVNFQMVNTAPGVIGGVAFGNTLPAPGLPDPLGRLYLFPVLDFVFGGTTSTSAISYLSVELNLPNNPALVGTTSFTFQGFIADPGAVRGVSHTDGIAITVGN